MPKSSVNLEDLSEERSHESRYLPTVLLVEYRTGGVKGEKGPPSQQSRLNHDGERGFFHDLACDG